MTSKKKTVCQSLKQIINFSQLDKYIPEQTTIDQNKYELITDLESTKDLVKILYMITEILQLIVKQHL